MQNRITLLIVLLCLVRTSTFQAQQVVCAGEPIIVEIQQANWGTLHLDFSADGETWQEVAALTDGTYLAELGNNGLYRARIFDADCGESYISNALELEIVACNTVYNPITGRIWMDRNLGAAQVATSPTDEAAYGDLYQWGRNTDGHQIRTSPTTLTLSDSAQPDHANYILNEETPYDWLATQDNNLWQGTSGINNPCPSGFRLPTQAEWDAERLSWSSTDSDGAFASPLKLPLAGHREFEDGIVVSTGSNARYWSSSTFELSSFMLDINANNALVQFSTRVIGLSVRCIKE
jgi:uncharacterized protein (TIGR02145 family)